MATQEAHAEIMEKLMNDVLTPEQELAACESCIRARPGVTSSILSILSGQKRRYRAQYEEAEAKRLELLKAVQEPPWHPAILRDHGAGMRAIVYAGGRDVCVGIAADIDPGKLRRGTSVLLNGHQNMVVALAPDFLRTGTVGMFSRFHGERQAVLRGPSDEELVVDVGADLLSSGLSNGDQVVFDREARVAWSRVAAPHKHDGLLERLPLDVRIEDLGGVREVFEEIVAEINLHLFHRDLVALYRLKRIKGLLLCGPPGTGKTSLVQAIAAHLGRTAGVEVVAFKVPPGAHRVMWFGESEKRIRELFQAILAAAKSGAIVLVFFDDMDHLGSRDQQVAGEVDAKLMPCFLQEVDNIRDDRVMLIGATNMESRLDEALIRPGRFGAIYRIGRPNREQARQIFSCHLPPELPLTDHGAPPAEAAQALIGEVLAAAYAPNGELSQLATLTFRDGTRRPVTAAQVMSGALIASAVNQAKRRVCERALTGGQPGITSADLMRALAGELDAIADRLRPGPALTQMLNLPQDMDVVRVERCGSRAPRKTEFLQAV